MNSPSAVRYRIDDQNRLVALSPEWEKFAVENDGQAVASQSMLGKDLFSCIADQTIRQLYRQLVAQARQGRPVTFTFRCDGPAVRRLFEMTISAESDGTVAFTSTLRQSEARPPVRLLDCHQPRNADFLTVCSWCQRIRAYGEWLSAEDAVAALNLMSAATLPTLTHGICAECSARMRASYGLA